MRKKPDLFFEESILDDFSKSFDSVEMPLSGRAFALVIFFVSIVGVIVFGRIFGLGMGNGDFYKNRAYANMSDITYLPAERGLFFDRFGKPLLSNTQSFRAVLKISAFLKKNDDDKKNELGQVAAILNLNSEEISEWIKSIDLERQNLIVLAKDLSVEQVAKIKNLDFGDIDIEQGFSRRYDDTGIYSHILGYVGSASPADLKLNPDLIMNDLVGKAGLELFYDDELRGKNGEIIDYRNAHNESLSKKISVPQKKGSNLYLTIDAQLQEFFYSALKSKLDSLGRVGGVGIAMDPKTGEILSLVSLPTFNNNKIKSSYLTDPGKPLFNRAVNGLYSPGSTIKPLVAIAALKEQILGPLKEIFSPGYIEIPNPYNPEKPSRFLDWKPQGWVNMYSALARSSNVYFYTVGGGFEDVKGLGIERLRNYWQKFGLDQKTGIDLPGEKSGFLPDIEEKEKRSGTPWRLGDTYNASIGQGDLMVTPLELINYISSIADGGLTHRLFVVKKIENENSDVMTEISPSTIIDNSSLLEFIKEAEKGMIDASEKTYGTAHMMGNLPFVVASKTGSAQIENNAKTNAFYVGYNLPQNKSEKNPVQSKTEGEAPEQIAVLVLIENAVEGSMNAVPVAREVFKWYYENRLKNSH